MDREDFELTQSTGGSLREPPLVSTSSTAGLDLLPSSDCAILYQVAMPQPESHLFEVTLRVHDWQAQTLDLKMPVWTPGSYLVREYSRHLQDFAAFSEPEGTPLRWQKMSKNHWQIETQGRSELVVCYRVFANELTVRTNHLDATHGYFNSAALFCFVAGFQHVPIRVKIVPPPGWAVTTALPSNRENNTFEAENFDALVDSPFEVGQHQIYPFEVLGKSHEFAIWGRGNLDVDRIINDTQKIIEVEAAIFGGLPYDRYIFFLHLTAQAFGGLEHKNSCSLIYSRLGFRAKDGYERFMQLVAHEFFHLWNIKRIRPKALEVFDYERENYTPSLWFSEGTTSFYDLLIPFRAGIYDAKTYLDALSREISRYLTTPGRLVQPLSESSFDAWIKLYRPDSNSANSQISYYLKGEMVTLLLDLAIRSRHQNQRSLDDVMRHLWEQFGKDEVGFTPEHLKSVLESVAGFDLTDFCDRYIDSTEELPFDEYLSGFGLRLVSQDETGIPTIGMTVKTEGGREMVKFVEANLPAQRAAIDPGDELVAIDGLRVGAGQLNERLKDYQSGDTIEVTVFHGDELKLRSLTLAPPRITQHHLKAIAHPSTVQQQNFEGWLGVSLSAVT
ncbi:M61 family metallopeptidase [Myxacorys almedinensis]|uniref:PDZ domain-containing protein n=1 Tax=Myxacorys almedinensis A TaxID=2690445 RepID=A0A8J7Z417_9CYAN|nr:M61 family metallopeptidase [Myxacorys almedinensis]NDJ17738.1 PDZ domain-containing protein [Myxacorys almedinensis A]